MDFTMSDKQTYWRKRVVDFMNEHVYPAVPVWEQQMHDFGAQRWQVPAVLDGLKAGDEVLLHPPDTVRDGSDVVKREEAK